MLVETENLVSVDQFKKDFDKYLVSTQQGEGPIAVAQNAEVVGFFMGVDDYEFVFGTAIRKLLSARTKGRKVTHRVAKARIKRHIRKATGGS
jgi:hypothetical protein